VEGLGRLGKALADLESSLPLPYPPSEPPNPDEEDLDFLSDLLRRPYPISGAVGAVGGSVVGLA